MVTNKRPNREKRIPLKLNDYVLSVSSSSPTNENFSKASSYDTFVNFSERTDLPETYEQAIKSHESLNWKKAMKKEIDCLNKNDTWKIVKEPKNKPIIDTKWIYRIKSDGTYKARLVARGFQQVVT